MKFEECITVDFHMHYNSVYEWFINQDHVPDSSFFDMSSDAHGTYCKLYQEFLKKIEHQYFITGYKYWWFTKNGQLMSDEGREAISGNSVRIDQSKIREYKIDQLLNI